MLTAPLIQTHVLVQVSLVFFSFFLIPWCQQLTKNTTWSMTPNELLLLGFTIFSVWLSMPIKKRKKKILFFWRNLLCNNAWHTRSVWLLWGLWHNFRNVRACGMCSFYTSEEIICLQSLCEYAELQIWIYKEMPACCVQQEAFRRHAAIIDSLFNFLMHLPTSLHI